MNELELNYAVVSFVAGLLSVLAPCVLPMLPVIIGSSTTTRSLKKPLTIIASLSISIILFTILLKASTALIGIDPKVWTYISGGILLVFGVLTLFPELWVSIETKLKLGGGNKVLGKGLKKGGSVGDVMVGAALGPIFSSCSPTYLAIASTVLPASPGVGAVYLALFMTGLLIPLVGVALLGTKLVGRLGKLSDPHGWFKRIIAVVFIVLGIMIIKGWDKQLERELVESGVYDSIVELEINLTD